MQNLSFAISGSLCDECDNLSAAWAAKSEGLLRGLQENPLNISRDEYDERVLRNYAERQQAEADARYEDFDIEEAEERLRDDGYEYTTRWHTRNPTAPLEQRDVWIIERKLPGIGAGLNHRQGLHQVRVGNNKWITYAEWRSATFANQNGFATELQKEWLKNGHWKA